MMEQLKELEERLQNILDLVAKLKKENEILLSKNSVLQTKIKESEDVLNEVLKENAQLKQEKEESTKVVGDRDLIQSKIEEMLKSIEKIEKGDEQ